MSADVPAAEDYESLPYTSMPYAQTQPSRLAAIATLHGMAPPAAETASVLELGCASGGNLIPLAARFPQARFLGFDLGRKHVEEAEKSIGELGLGNIEIRQGDIAQLRLTEKVDYIICHGVFSWTPRAVQEAVFALCRDALSASGVAFVSFNVLPGWRMRGAIRDLCLRHTAGEPAPSRRVAMVRALLNDIASLSNASEPYGLLLRSEAQRIAHRPASYIMGEFMSAENEAFFFSEFEERARRFELSYLADADLEAAVPETLSPSFQQRLAVYADSAQREQYIDYFTGRPFRGALLVNASVARTPFDAARLQHLQLSGELTPTAGAGDTAPSFEDARGRAVRSSDPAVRQALARLAGANPATLSFSELVAAGDTQSAARVCESLGLLLRAGQLGVSSASLRVGKGDAARPRAWEVARKQAASGAPFVTNQAHAPVLVKPITAWMLARLDGATEQSLLTTNLADVLRHGELKVPEMTRANADVDGIARGYVNRALQYLADKALLIG